MQQTVWKHVLIILKTCQILNKTTTIIDKVKVHSDYLNYRHVLPNGKTTEKNETNDKSNPVHVNSHNKQIVQTNQKQPNNQNQNTRKTEHVKRINANNRHSASDNCLHVLSGQNRDMQEHETADLTCSYQQKQTIDQSTLLARTT